MELHWIRGHSRIGGNERVDRISKRYASIANNSERIPIDHTLGAHITRTNWPFGFPLTGLPEAYFLLRLPLPPCLAVADQHVSVLRSIIPLPSDLLVAAARPARKRKSVCEAAVKSPPERRSMRLAVLFSPTNSTVLDSESVSLVSTGILASTVSPPSTPVFRSIVSSFDPLRCLV